MNTYYKYLQFITDHPIPIMCNLALNLNFFLTSGYVCCIYLGTVSLNRHSINALVMLVIELKMAFTVSIFHFSVM